ncbi:sacsin-like [Glandiceps talaboti]
MSSSEDDFGQEVPPLYIYLKRILDKYPEGGQILKEIIQNADDAGATEVKFLYDNTEYPQTNLWSEDLRNYHGPALYAFNNSKFSEKDWLSIQRPEQSGKADDPLKVGRFGLGFNSVYHITDLPSVLSGKWLGVFDPLEKIFAYDPYKNKKYSNKPGKKWKLKGELLSHDHTPYSDQFKPYLGIFGCDSSSFDRGDYDGTLFRFPLRKHPSELSSNVITEDRIVGPEGWITSFKEDIGLTLLFLKNIEAIHIYERHRIDGDITLLQGAKISESVRQQVRFQKAAFLEQVKHNKHTMPVSINVEIEVEEKHSTETKHWIVVHQVKSPESSSELKTLANDKELNLLPWVGAAVEMEHRQQSERGRIFCFLPLPPSQTTGLPVHIHGYFGLGDNRRSIKWPDSESKQDKTAKWNLLLTSDAIPEVYAKLILTAITEYKWKPDRIYAAWPDPSIVKSKEWQLIFKKLLKLLVQHKIFYTDASGGKWVHLSDAIFDIPDRYVSTDIRETVVNTMLKDGAPVVTVPSHVINCLEMQYIQINEMSPQLVRNQLKKGASLSQMTRQSKLLLLEYVLSDRAFHDLQGLNLLPLDDGSFTSFSTPYYGNKIFIATDGNPQSLLPNMENRFLERNLKPSLKKVLMEPRVATQLTLLTAALVVQNIRSALPYNWTSGSQSTVLWYPGIQGAPPQDWLSKFWTWFRNKREIDISKLEGLPLIPIDSVASTITLLKLQRGPRAIFKQVQSFMTSTSIPDEIVNLVERLGYFVVINQASWLQHTSLNNYIAYPNASGVLKILQCVGAVKVARFLENNTNSVESVCRFLTQLTSQDIHDSKQLLVELPLFESVQGGKYLSISQCRIIAPSDYSNLPCRNLKKRLLICSEQSRLKFAECLGARQIGFDNFLEDFVLAEIQNGNFTTDEALSIMSWTLCRPQFDTVVKKFRCIPSKGGPLFQPDSIIDPDNDLMITLLGDSNTPMAPYSSGSLLASIRRVGLSNDGDISSEKLYSIAKELHASNNQFTKNNRTKAEALLQYIDVYISKLKEQIFVQGIKKSLADRLKSLSWIPCVSEPPTTYPSNLDWFGSQGYNALILYRPADVTVMENCYLVGGTMPIVHLKGPNSWLTSVFQRKQPLDGNSYMYVQNVVWQLQKIATSESSTWNHSPIMKSTVDIITDIYKFLSACNVTLVKEFIKGDGTTSRFPWIWEGKGFTYPEKVSLSSRLSIDMKPYLFTLPMEFTEQLKNFFLEMGVSQQFTQEALIDVLQQIKEKHSQPVSQAQIESDLKLCCEILQVIVKDSMINYELTKKIVVPVSTPEENSLLLLPAHQCLYRDREWLSAETDGVQYHVIHEDIPTSTAKKLGLKPLSHFAAPTEGLGYDLAGPHETVINAIKRNLDMYKQGEEIFKEIIQNADDAGASEVKFLIDLRENAEVQQRLLDPEMRHCHGPALWAYNDALFSEDDIRNICDIAAASKKQTVEKIGRFGLGFTSVYHVTDVPSLVSGHHIMMFDPRLTHLKSRITNPSQPGVKLDLRKDSHKDTVKIHPDQFKPYHNVFGCNIADNHYYKGTLFRLPLRSAHQVTMENIITDKVYQDKTLLKELTLSLMEAAPTILLFTQNVKKMSLSELKPGSHDGSSAVEMLSINSKLKRQLPRMITQAVAVAPHIPISKLQEQTNILTATSQWIKQKNKSAPETSYVVEMSFKSKLSKSTKKITSKDIWLISSCASNSTSLKRAEEPEGRRQGVLPCGGVAAKLVAGEAGLTPSPVEGRLYSFLPVAVPTGLPVHINASFALQPNRRHIWSKTTQTDKAQRRDFEADWNHDLMSDVICKAFINLSQDLKEMQDLVGSYDFQTLWPDIYKCESDFHPFVIAFYQVVSGRKGTSVPAIIHNGLQWVELQQCNLLGDDIDNSEISKKATILLNEQCHPRKVIALNQSVQRGFQRSGAGDILSKNTYTMKRLYKDVFFQCIDDLAPDIRNPMVTYLLDKRMGTQKDKSFDSDLKKYSCIPVSPDGLSTDLPSRVVDPQSLVGKLFDEDDGRFPYDEDLRTSDRLLSLRELGMATTTLTWEDICDRAQSVYNVLEQDGFQAAVERTSIILQVMKNLVDAERYPSNSTKAELSEIPFLPVRSKPKGYPIEWLGESNKVSCGKTLFAYEFANLIGSVAEVLDESKIDQKQLTPCIQSILGVQLEVPIANVISQLKLLMQCKDMKKVEKACVKVYNYLESIVCEESDGLNIGDSLVQVKNGSEGVVQELKTLEMFWVSDAFVGVNRLAFNWQEFTTPYLYKVPREIMKNKRLLQVCGVREEFDINDYLSVLDEIKTKKGNNALEKSELETVLTLIRKIAEKEIPSEVLEQREIYVPDTDNILRSTKDLTFDDAPFLRKKTDYIFSHDNLPWVQANKLGIVPAREKKAKEISSFEGFAHDFGQKEELTDRLKDILRAYPGDSEILKELLQNADDAKATEVHVIYDPRSHPTESIFSKSWAAMQKRPAICVYNNRTFSDEDIKGIQRVGIGGKRSDAETTGQYGIGFNSVYHLTDCPSFLSDSTKLGIFDPHMKYITSSSTDNPGILFDPISKVRETFEDTLSGYLLSDQIPLEGGTLFRFPLRQHGDRSDISHTTFDEWNGRNLLDKFKIQAFDSLLFLNYVKTIKISEITQSGQLKQLYSVEAEMTKTDEEERARLAQYISSNKNTIASDIAAKLVHYDLSIKDSEGRNEQLLVVQQFGFAVPPSVDLTHEDIGRLLPRVGVAAIVSDYPTKSEQLLCSELKAGATIQPSRTHRKRCSAYCFLPLPIETNLPVLVNGHFALDRSRRYLWKDTSDSFQSFRSAWNEQLIGRALAPAYAYLLQTAARRCNCEWETRSKSSERGSGDINLKWYHSLFPIYKEVDKTEAGVTWTRKGEWNFLAQKTLVHIAEMEMEVLPVIKPMTNESNKTTLEWFSPVNEEKRIFFDRLNNSESMKMVKGFLLKSGFKLLASPVQVYESFKDAGVDVLEITPTHVVDFMRTSECMIGTMPCKLEDTTFETMATYLKVLKFCLDGLSNPDDLTGLPLLLVANETLKAYDCCDVPYFSYFSCLFESMPEKFIHRDTLKALTEYLKKNDLSFSSKVWQDLTPREVATNICSVLPSEWLNIENMVNLNEVPHKDTIVIWLKLLWQYLCGREDENVLQPLIDWPIIPVKDGLLITPSKGKSVLDLFSFEDETGFRLHVINVLKMIGCKEVTCRSINDDKISTKEKIGKLLQPYVTSPKECKNVLSMLGSMLHNNLLTFKELNEDKAELLLQYFQELFECNGNTNDGKDIEILKKLPIHHKNSGGFTSIDGYSNCHSLTGTLPSVEEDIWKSKCSCVFLYPKQRLHLIMQALGVNEISDIDVYLKYVIPNFHNMSHNARITHMKHIRDYIIRPFSYNEEQKDQMLTVLASTEFIPSIDSEVKRADYFFDPYNDVFMEMEDRAKLLPKEFTDDSKWREFLIKLGLKTTVTKDLFLKYINTVAAEALRTNHAQIKNVIGRSRLLAKELSFNKSLQQPHILLEVSKIKFIPSARVQPELVAIHPPYMQEGTNRIPFICYRGNIAEGHMELAWSCAFLLPHWAIPTCRCVYLDCKSNLKIDLHECLGISDSESLDSVITHCQNICDRMAEENCPETRDKVKKETRNKLKDVLEKLYIHFGNNLSHFNLKVRLENTPLVLVDDDRVLVRANQLAHKFGTLKGNELQPYMYLTPRALGKYETFLKTIGTEEDATAKQFAVVLASIHEKCKDKIMTPNEMKTAMAATKGLFQYLLENKDKDVCSKIQHLYLTSSIGKLMKSVDLYYGNRLVVCRIDVSKYPFMLSLSECGCDDKDGSVTVELLPEKLRPRDIQHDVVERIDPDAEPCVARDTCPFQNHFQEVLNSDEFVQVLCRIVRFQQKHKPLEGDTREIILAFKGKLEVHCMKHLTTKLFYPKSKEYIEQSQWKASIFVDSNTKLYVQHEMVPGSPPFLALLTRRINRLLKWKINDTASLLAILSLPSVEQFSDVLTSEFHIPEYDYKMATEENKHGPGKVVPADIECLLDDNPINTFRNGEIVALRKEIHEAFGTDEAQSHEYIFAEIKDIIDPGDQADGSLGLGRQYRVDVGGNEYIVVSGNDLYKFIRPEEPKPKELVVYSGPVDDSTPQTQPTANVSLEEAKDEIKQALKEAFQLSKDERDKVIRRLYKRWHPDKNRGNEYIATEAFKFLKQEIDRLESGRPEKESYNRFYDSWNEEARSQKRQREDYERDFFAHSNRSRRSSRSSRSYVPPSFHKTIPNPRAARTWFKHAKEDLRTASHDMNARSPSYSWVCFKVHQAVEKALKAAKFSMDGDPDHKSTNLLNLAYAVQRHKDCPDDVDKDAVELERLGCDFNDTRYPQHDHTNTRLYTQDQAEGAMEVAGRLLEKMREFIGIQRF